MRDHANSQAPAAAGATPDAPPPDAPPPGAAVQPSGTGAERGTAPGRARSRTSVMLKRFVAGAALTGLTELSLGRRLYFAWEGLRRAVKWVEKPEAQKPGTNEQQAAARPPPSIPSPQEAVEAVVQEVMDWGQRTVERHKPMVKRAGNNVREQLKEPSIGAAVIGGTVLGAVASVGILPAAVGAGTAYLVYRKMSSRSPSHRR